MTQLPPLTKVRDLGGDEFEKLLHQLLLAYADRARPQFAYEPHGKSGAKDDGIDGLARQGRVPGLKGPVAFQFKWLAGNLSKGDNAQQIKKSVKDASGAELKFAHYVLVTPENITPAQKQWLRGLPKALGLPKTFEIHHWGQARIASLFRPAPELLAEYYPESARAASTAHATRKLLDGYLAWLIEDCAPLKLRAIDQGAGRSDRQALGLTSVYLDLELTLRLPKERSLVDHLRQPSSEVPPTMEPEGRGRPGEDKSEDRRVAVMEALAAHPRLVLLGAPGSGKSTLAAYLALTLAEAKRGRKKSLARLGSWWQSGALPPIRVVLREFAASLPRNTRRGRAQHLWDFLAAEIERRGLPRQTIAALRELAADSGALFLLDGLDEAREAATRDRVLEAVTEFAAAAGDRCRFLLSTRPYAWEQAAAAQADWPCSYRLADFSPEQIETFIGRWFEAVRTLGWIGQTEAGEKTANLRQAVGRRDIQPLAANPLLLTLMATLLTNRYRLPDDRADLYDEVVKLLLQRWSETSGADRGLLDALAIPGLTLDHLREVMQQLAYEAHEQHAGEDGVANIHEGELLAKLRLLLGDDIAKADLALEYIEKRAGLLLGQGPRGHERQYTFPHRTFQEYLAACWLANQPDFCQRAVALARQNPAHWREVLTFAARLAKAGRGVPAADALVHGESVIEWGKDHSPADGDWRAAVLAGEQLLEIGLAAVGVSEHHRAVRRRVAGWLGALLDRGALPVTERANAGVVLGRLGDERPGVGVKNGVPDISWIEIPPGTFTMGKGDEEHPCDIIQQPYLISRYPVTVAQYQAFVDAKGYHEERFWTLDGWKWRQSHDRTGPANDAAVFLTANHPRVGVTWYEALAFCRWLSESLKRHVTLPSDAEWQRAARHNDGRRWPWGNERGDIRQRCNIGRTGIGHTTAVGMFPDGHAQCGAADMAGNVWDWTRSLWRMSPQGCSSYPCRPDNGPEDLDAASNVVRMMRGNSFATEARVPPWEYRVGNSPERWSWNIGFRLVASPCASER